MTTSNLLTCINIFCVRLAVLGLYQRMFSIYDTSRRLIYVGYALIVVALIPDLTIALARMTQCSGLINPTKTDLCGAQNLNIALLTFSVFGVLLDVYIYSLAIFRLRVLQVEKLKRLQLMCLLALGAV